MTSNVNTYINKFGQLIRPGDRVVCVTTGYSHSVATREGVFVGVSPRNSPQVRTERRVWVYDRKTNTGQYEMKSVIVTCHSGRVFKLAME